MSGVDIVEGDMNQERGDTKQCGKNESHDPSDNEIVMCKCIA